MNELLEKIESYDFKDPLGHELKWCAEWMALKELIDWIKLKYETGTLNPMFLKGIFENKAE